MMLDATQRYLEPLSEERLYAWHAALFPTGRSGMTRIVVCAWRNEASGPMQVVSGPFGRERVHYEAPVAVRLHEEMAAFIAWFNSDIPLDFVMKAMIAHLWFVTIHPFDDGNGRIARAIADMALAQSEGSPQRFYKSASRGATITQFLSGPRRAASISPAGCFGASPASIGRSPARRVCSPTCSARLGSGKRWPDSHSTNASFRCSIAC